MGGERTMMNKKNLLPVLALVVVLLATLYIGTAYAKPPTQVAGTIELVGVVPSPGHTAGESDNQFLVMDLTEAWDGDIVATGTTVGYWTVHNAPFMVNPDSWVCVHEKLLLDGTVLGFPGTVTMQLNIAGTEGRWSIIDGTGGLANLRGQGTLTLTTTPYSYTGQVHFAPP
jgi:hypothetical protein